MAGDNLSGADIRRRFKDSDASGSDTGSTEEPKSGADIRQRFRESDAATSTVEPDDPYSLKHAWIQIPMLHNFAAGVTQGARNVVKSGLDAGAWVDERVPLLKWLDEHNPLIGDPEKRKAEFEQQRKKFEASPEGQSYTGKAGELVGEISTTLPLAGPVGETVGAGVSAATRAAPRVVQWLARTAAEGGAGGATFGALTEGGSDKPLGEYISENALLGAVLGPPVSLIAKGVGATARGVKGAYDYYFNRAAPAAEVDAAIDAARARVGVSGGDQGPPGGGGGGGSAPTPRQPAPTATTTPATPQAGGAQATTAEELAANAPDRAREIAGKVSTLDQMISQRPNIGQADFAEHVKGNLPTQAEGLGDAELATIQRQLEEDQRFVNRRKTLNDNRQDHYDNQAGTAEQLDTLEKDIAAWDKETLEPVWSRKSPVDASGVEAEIKARLASPEAQVGPIEAALKEVEQRLYNRSTGELHTDPQMLYGARRHISHLLSRAGQKANPAYADDAVMSELIAMRDSIDRAIEPGAPGFKAWVTEHANKMRDVDRMTLLQSMRSKIIGADGEIQGSRLVTQLKALRTMMARGGANPAHSLTQEDLEMLRDLHTDLLREGNRKLAMPLGSNTRQNLNTAATHGFDVANALLQHGASRIPLGGEALAAFQRQAAAKNAALSREQWIRRLLEPPPAGSGGP